MGREIKNWVVPQPLGIALVIAVLVFGGYIYKSGTSDQRETRDAVIRMETMLTERTRSFERQQDKMEVTLSNEIKLASMHREREASEKSQLVAALRQHGIIAGK